jgi:hypothetical protein
MRQRSTDVYRRVRFCVRVHRRIQKRNLGGGQMASAVARAYSGGLGAEPPDGSRGKAPGEGSGGEAPLKLTIFYY